MDLYRRELTAPLGFMRRHPKSGLLTVKSPIQLRVKLPDGSVLHVKLRGGLEVDSFLEALVLAWEARRLGTEEQVRGRQPTCLPGRAARVRSRRACRPASSCPALQLPALLQAAHP